MRRICVKELNLLEGARLKDMEEFIIHHQFEGYSVVISFASDELSFAHNSLHRRASSLCFQILCNAQCVHWSVFFSLDRARSDIS